MIRIGYQGIEGSNSEEAAKLFCEKLGIRCDEFVPLINSQNVVNKLDEKEIEYGVLAIKNVIAGDVQETKRALENRDDIKIISDLVIEINHCLFKKNENVDIKNIRKIASHIQALLQTSCFRKEKFPNAQAVETADTALAAKDLSEGKISDDTLVICRKNAGEMYNLCLVCENIGDRKDNSTQFIIIKK